MLKYVIVAILLFCSGFMDSIAGGGGLISLPAFLLAGLPPHMALATNKFSSSIGTTASTARFFSQGYMHKDAFIYIVLALSGAHLGSSLAVQIPERYFQYLMLIILPIVAAISFYSDRVRRKHAQAELKKLDDSISPGTSSSGTASSGTASYGTASSGTTSSGTASSITAEARTDSSSVSSVSSSVSSSASSSDSSSDSSSARSSDSSSASTTCTLSDHAEIAQQTASTAADDQSLLKEPAFFAGLSRKQFIIAAASALVVGTYDGFYGPGTGTFLILLLTQVAHIDVRRSAATTKAINLSSNIGSLIFFLGTNLIDYRLGLVGAAFSLLGHYLGSGLVIKDGQKYVRPLIIVVLILLFIKVISDLLA